MPTQNERVAQVFQSIATLLASQRANPYRIRAYRRAADSILALEEDVALVAQRQELEDINGIGKDLAGKIREFLETGTIRTYEELKTPLPPEVKNWARLPGLHDSLEQLVSSHLLRTVPGFTGSEDALLQAIRQQKSSLPG
jgi:DNA polymerase (family 10)